MSLFLLDTDTVNGVKSNLDSLASQINSITSSVSGYDTACDEFDFAGAKSVIASNIEAASIKVRNTSTIIENVINSHTELQNKLKFQSSSDSSTTSDSTSTGSTSTGTTTGASTSTGSTSTGSTGTIVPPITTTPVTDPQNVDVTITKVEHSKVDTSNLSDESKAIFDEVEYDENGYATYKGLYVISCSKDIGKVGEHVTFTLNDGTIVKCIVGANTENSGEIHFFVNDQWKEDNSKNISKDFASNVKSYKNSGLFQANNTTVNMTNLPNIGEHTSKLATLNDDWTVATTKISVTDYAKVIQNNKITQDSDKEKYGDDCLAFAYVHASNLYNGTTSDTNVSAGNYKHASEFTEFQSDSKTETLNKIYSEIVQGHPVVMQVNGNKEGTSRHFVTVVGFRNSVTDPANLTEKDLIIIDSWDGKVERMDQENSRFMTTGKQTGNSGYTGYNLRVLKS